MQHEPMALDRNLALVEYLPSVVVEHGTTNQWKLLVLAWWTVIPSQLDELICPPVTRDQAGGQERHHSPHLPVQLASRGCDTHTRSDDWHLLLRLCTLHICD